MNVAMMQRPKAAGRALEGKVALITGSTSGIGLGIARALGRRRRGRRPQWLRQARGDCCIPGRHSLGFRGEGRLFGRRHVEPRLDRRDDRNGARRFRPHRHPGQQCRHSARRAASGIPDGEMGRDPRHQSLLGISHHAARAAVHAREQIRPYRQYRLRPWAGRLAVQIGLCRGETRHARADQSHSTRDGRSPASPATRSAPAMSIRRWSKRRSRARRKAMASPASR